MLKKVAFSIISFVAVLTIPAVAFAHVVVQPNQVGIGKFQTFSVSVPTEKDVPTVGLRLVLPAGLQEVSPTVKPGWQIDTKKTGTGDDAEVTEIDWTNGSVPAGQRDDFTFSAQVPATATTLQWKAYQTYQDGSVVSWDQTPAGSDDANGDKGPYSTTKIVDDLNTAAPTTKSQAGPYTLSIAALALAVVALVSSRKKVRR